MKLANYIEAARTLSAERDKNSIIFWGTAKDKPFLPHLKPCTGNHTTRVRIAPIQMVGELRMYCENNKCYKVATTSIALLRLLLNWDERKDPSLDNYAGSYFTVPCKDGVIEIVFVPPLKQLATVSYGPFMMVRYLTKLTAPQDWLEPPAFNWTILAPENEAEEFLAFQRADLIAIDIETVKENCAIKCLSYTAFNIDLNTCRTVVLPLDSDWAVAVMRKWCWQLKAPKIFQNGRYDLSYLTRFSAIVYNYLYDTADMFHSIYSELPKDLGFLNAFYIREAFYWKDLAKTNDLHEYYRYNALDTWGTGCCFLAMLRELPDYALHNYVNKFPVIHAAHMCEMRGIKRDMERLRSAATETTATIDSELAKLNVMLDIPEGDSFNTNSPIQMKQLLKILGCGDMTKADANSLAKAAYRHPLNKRILDKVIDIRKARKMVSTYLTEGKEFNGRVLYGLNASGTDTSRLASASHHFWCGLNIQNIPRGPAVKQTFVADPGFAFGECDLEQAESRDTAYISGDKTLIHNVEYSPDFHCANASAFFGIPFEELYDTATGKKLNKAIRDLAKRVNHGANYNMGPNVLVDTMGLENIFEARRLLNLPRGWDAKQIAEHLLLQFHKTYVDIGEVFYAGVIKEILKTGCLTSKALHHSWADTPNLDKHLEVWEEEYIELEKAGSINAWTRRTFANPTKSKRALNTYVAHPPQSLNAQTLNRAFISVFKDIALNPKYSEHFKLLAQIHDSIFYQYRLGHEYLNDMVKERMEIPITIRSYGGVINSFVVPAEPKTGINNLPALYWSETE